MGIFSNIIGGIGNLGLPLIGTGYNIFSNERAYRTDEQKYREQMAWQTSENEIMRAREDNAVQRRMQDLKAGGINPILAGGGQAGASMGGVTPMQQTRKDETSGQMIANLISQKAQLDNVKAQTGVAKAQADNVKAQTGAAKAQEEVAKAQAEEIREKTKGYQGQRDNVKIETALKKLQKEMNDYDFNLSKKTFTKTNASGIVADITNAINAISGVFGKENLAKEGIDYAKNSIKEIMDITNQLANVPEERKEEIMNEIKTEVPKLIEKAPERVKNEWYSGVQRDKYNPIAWAIRKTKGYKEWEEAQKQKSNKK